MICLGLPADFCQQLFPHLDKGMRLLFQHKTYLVGNHCTISLNNMRQIHKRIVHLTCLIHRPRLLGLSKKMLQTLADDGAADIQHKIWHVTFVIPNECNSFIEVRIHGLTSYQHRTLRLHKHATDMTQHMSRHIGRNQLYLPLIGQRSNGKVEQRFRYGYIDMDGTTNSHQRLVDKTVTIPMFFIVMRLN